MFKLEVVSFAAGAVAGYFYPHFNACLMCLTAVKFCIAIFAQILNGQKLSPMSVLALASYNFCFECTSNRLYSVVFDVSLLISFMLGTTVPKCTASLHVATA